MKVDNFFVSDWSSTARASPAGFTVSVSSAKFTVCHSAGNAGATNDSVLPTLACPPLHLGTAADSVVAVMNEISAPPDDPPLVSATPRAPALYFALVISTSKRNNFSVSAGVPRRPVGYYGRQPSHQPIPPPRSPSRLHRNQHLTALSDTASTSRPKLSTPATRLSPPRPPVPQRLHGRSAASPYTTAAPRFRI